MIVADPCYGNPEHGKFTWVGDVAKGEWIAMSEISDEGLWGKRVAMLEAIKKGYENGQPWERMDFVLGVDSGQMSIVDHFEGFGDGEYDDPCSWYGSVSSISLKHRHGGIIERDERKIGFVSSTGFGDGAYDGYVKRDANGTVVGLRVVFLE